MKEETFFINLGEGWRFIIIESVRESLGLEVGDLLRITIQVEAPGEDLCPHILDYPLQDPEVCREWDCPHYTREPDTCHWPGWKKEVE